MICEGKVRPSNTFCKRKGDQPMHFLVRACLHPKHLNPIIKNPSLPMHLGDSRSETIIVIPSHSHLAPCQLLSIRWKGLLKVFSSGVPMFLQGWVFCNKQDDIPPYITQLEFYSQYKHISYTVLVLMSYFSHLWHEPVAWMMTCFDFIALQAAMSLAAFRT